MYKKIKDLLRGKAHAIAVSQSEWVKGYPQDDTLGGGNKLPWPEVSQPTADMLRGIELPRTPGYIALEVTNTCNLRCKHCNYRYGLDHYTRDRGFISQQLVDKVFREAVDNNISILMNYDGEPLMHRKFLDFLMQATELKINTYFNTNGTKFNKEVTDKIVKFYKGSIFFSIDGDKDWFEKIRIPANYEVVISNIEYFSKVNEENGWPITVGVSLCNLGQEAEGRKTFLKKWLPKVNYVSMGEVNDKFGAMMSIPMTKLGAVKKRPVCSVPWQTCGICHNGDVIPCSIYVTRANTCDAIFGNIFENSLQEIWSGTKFNEFRKKLAKEKYVQTYCDKCERWLAQFSFPEVFEKNMKIVRNGYWTTFQNLDKGKLNFQDK